MASKDWFLSPDEINALPWSPDPDHDLNGTGRVYGGGGSCQYVYSIREEPLRSDAKNVYWKVGRTSDPEKRLSNLQTGNPRKLQINAVEVTNMVTAEAALFRALEKYQYDLGGGTEWFKVDNEKAFKSQFTKTIK